MTGYLWWSPGILFNIIPDGLRYFKPGFHPWQLDNRQYLQQIRDVVETVEGCDDPAAADAV